MIQGELQAARRAFRVNAERDKYEAWSERGALDSGLGVPHRACPALRPWAWPRASVRELRSPRPSRVMRPYAGYEPPKARWPAALCG